MITIFKKYIRIIVLVLLGILVLNNIRLYYNNKDLEKNLSISKNNEKAFIKENSSLKEQQIMFQFSTEQLYYLKDSLITEMNKVRDSLKIKDKNLKQMQYLKSRVSKIDTLIFKDTIFVDSLNLDTVIKDDWYNLSLRLSYPNNIIVSPEFKSEKFIYSSSKKETVNPPRKFFLFRWFQKKHYVVEVDIVEKNPYIKSEQSKFIEIIK